jgi:predicted Zn-dependent protease
LACFGGSGGRGEKVEPAVYRLPFCGFRPECLPFQGETLATSEKTENSFLEQFEPDVFWEQHGQKIIWALIGIAVVGVVVYVWQRQRAQQAEEAESRLATAADPSALEGIIRDYPDQQVAADAMIRLADIDFRNGRFTDAADVYQRFVSAFPNHPLLETAELGLAAIQEAQGNLQAAKDQYALLASSHPGGYTALAARMGAARCAELLGQTKEARQLYEELLPAVQNSPWQVEAVVRYAVLSRQQPEAPTGVSQPQVKLPPLISNAPVSSTGTLR